MVVSKRGFDMFRHQNNEVDCSCVKGNPLFLGYCTPFTFIEKDSSEGKMGTVANQQLCAGLWLQFLWEIWKISDGTFISSAFFGVMFFHFQIWHPAYSSNILKPKAITVNTVANNKQPYLIYNKQPYLIYLRLSFRWISDLSDLSFSFDYCLMRIHGFKSSPQYHG
jgi:hypothetical protein